MANLHCPCGRPLQDSRAFFCPACLFNHYSQQHSHNQRYTGDRFTLPERPKSTSNSPPPSHNNWQHANPRKSMDSSAASTRPSSSSADHKPPSPLSRPRQTTQYTSSSSTASISSSPYSRQSSVSSASSARNGSVSGAYAPIAAGFARLSRKDNSLVRSETGLSRGGSPARSGVELEAARMFAGAA